jgi:hypothetical protein
MSKRMRYTHGKTKKASTERAVTAIEMRRRICGEIAAKRMMPLERTSLRLSASAHIERGQRTRTA